MSEVIASPCINVCLLDNNDICVGCHRSADEITQWMVCDDAGKKDILKRCRERFEAEKTQHFK